MTGNPTSTPLIVTADRLVEYPFPIRHDVNAYLIVPRDITTEEVKRLARYMETLARAPQQEAP